MRDNTMLVKHAYVSSEIRDIRTMKRVAAISLAGGAAIATLAWLNPPDTTADPASTPEVRAQVASCVAAKPEIEAAARGRSGFDWNHVLEERIAAVNAHDPAQCGEMLKRMRDARKQAEDAVMMGILASS